LDNRPDHRWRRDLDQLLCYRKIIFGSIEPISSGRSAFIAHVTLYASTLGVAIGQARYATGENYERNVHRKLLGELDHQGMLIKADALHTQKPFLNRSLNQQQSCTSPRSPII
jgi:hypothetical protein